MSTVVMLLSNSFRPDPRVAREAAALVRTGLEVTVVCWDRRREFPERDSFAFRTQGRARVREKLV